MVLKLRSLAQLFTGTFAETVSKFRIFGKKFALQASKASDAFVGRVAISCFFHFFFQRIIY